MNDGMYYHLVVRFYDPEPDIIRSKGWLRAGPATRHMYKLKLQAAALGESLDVWLEPIAPAPEGIKK